MEERRISIITTDNRPVITIRSAADLWEPMAAQNLVLELCGESFQYVAHWYQTYDSSWTIEVTTHTQRMPYHSSADDDDGEKQSD